MTALAIAVGGGIGALARYRLEGVIAPRQRTPFPLSTLVINVTGSTALGLLVGAVGLSAGVVPLLGTGFLGGYTTFSTFTYENMQLVQDRAWRYVAWNVVLSGSLSFAGAAAGYALMRLT